MSFNTFRDSFLAEAETRITAVNPTTATTNDLLVSGALYKMAASVASLDLISTQALSLLTAMSGTQLESYLQNPDAMLSFQRIVADTPAMNTLVLNGSIMSAIMASTTAMSAIAASTTAMNAITASTTAMSAIAASTTAMNAINGSSLAIAKYSASLAGLDPTVYAGMNDIAASTTAMNAIAASTTAMSAIAASTTAMNAITASTTAMSAIAASPLSVTYTSPNTVWVPSGASGEQVIFSGRCLLVQAQISPTASYLTNPGGSGQGVYVDGVVTYFTATHAYNMVAGEVLTTPKIAACNSSLGINTYCGLIVTYIPL